MSRRDPVPARVAWAVEVVDPRPDDVVLEVGGGPGVSAALVCDRLSTGRLVAVDRSPVAVRRTLARNSRHVASGRLEVHLAELAGVGLAAGSVDRAFAVDVNVFWTTTASAELDELARVLRPGGSVHLLYGSAGPTGEGRVVAAVSGALTRHGFVDVAPLRSAAGFGVRGRRGPDRPGR